MFDHSSSYNRKLTKLSLILGCYGVTKPNSIFSCSLNCSILLIAARIDFLALDGVFGDKYYTS